MKYKITFYLCIFVQCSLGQIFESNWKSLGQYKAPDWYKDAKFGIFMHWGIQSVPAHENGWYARQMYQQTGAEWGHTYDYHIKTYGHPSEFGYKDLIPLWRAEKWDPDELVKLYKKIGAKYIVPVAVHHDNFDNYASTYQPWNSVNMGPKKDIVGEWKKACDKYGMRFGVSSHSDRSWDWFSTSHGSDTVGAKAGVTYDGNLTKSDGKGKWWEGYDPRDLYSRPHLITEAPDIAYREKWFNRTKELVDKYHPDLLWFDGPLPMVCSSPACDVARPELEQYGLVIASYFYNENQKWHDGKLDAVLNIKTWKHYDVPDSSAIVLDIEKGQTQDILNNVWQTDTSIPSDWYENSMPPELSDTTIIHNLCDIVSKNGNLLLNVGLQADGILPDDQKTILLSIGMWLEQNGEAIYCTRPWKIFGEGPTNIAEGDFKQNKVNMSARDIRFTTKDSTLYVIMMGWPDDNRVLIHSITSQNLPWFGEIGSITLIGEKASLPWKINTENLFIHLPDKHKDQLAYVMKLRGK